MEIKFYPKTNGAERGYTPDEITKGHMWIYADVACPHCDKLQPVVATGYVGGPCVRCGQRTDGSSQPAYGHTEKTSEPEVS